MMSPKETIDAALFFVSQGGMPTAPRFAAAFVGLVICVLTVTGLWERRGRVAFGILRLLVGILLVVIGLNTPVLHWLMDMAYLTRIRLVMGLLSLFVLGVTLEAIRRDQLKERYALLWVATGLMVLLCAFFPQILSFLTALLGVQYPTALVGVVFTFLLLVAFHFSIVLSGFHDNQTRIAQRCALLEERLDQLAAEVAVLKGQTPPIADVRSVAAQTPQIPRTAEPVKRRWHGSIAAIPLVILLATLAVLAVGLATPQPMIGDEATHYYRLVRQEQTWPVPNFRADIPMGGGVTEQRTCPGAFLWHYLGATLGRVMGHSLVLVQSYQTLFWLQFLGAAFFLARGRGADRRSVLLFLLVLASLPMGIIFSIAFCPDVPMAAQVLTAFCLLDRRRWLLASVFMAAALATMETALLFLPAFFVFLGWRVFSAVQDAGDRTVPGGRRTARTAVALALAGTVIGVSMGLTARALSVYGGVDHYPVAELQRLAQPGQANPHPFIIYGGFVLWLGLLLGVAGRVWAWRTAAASGVAAPVLWPLLVGVAYCIPLACVSGAAPDARAFLPGIPFLLLPFVQWAVRLPRPKLIISIVAVLAMLQGGQVLAKTCHMRQVSADLRAGADFLRAHPPSPSTVFMCPEENDRIFPAPAEWALGSHLREFWKGDNDTRISLLHGHGIGAIVVKKYLVHPVDENTTDLDVYPDYFVRDIERDQRFRKVLDNRGITIFLVPQ